MEDLERWSKDLASQSVGRRQQAFEGFLHLDEESLGALTAYLERGPLKRRRWRRHQSEARYQAFNLFRREVGSRRADDDVDLIPGVLPVLAKNRSARVASAAEMLLIARALERLASDRSRALLLRLISNDFQAWRAECKRVVYSMREHALPMLIEVRSHPKPELRRWSRWGLKHLNARTPAKAIRNTDGPLLASILRAYGEVKLSSAAKVVVSFIAAEQQVVRRAARQSLKLYGSTALWPLRERYRTQFGEQPDPNWSAKILASKLYRDADDTEAELVAPLLAEAQRALDEGSPKKAEDALEELLLRRPQPSESRPLAETVVALANQLERAGNSEAAARWLARAGRIDLAHPARQRWRDRAAQLEEAALFEVGILARPMAAEAASMPVTRLAQLARDEVSRAMRRLVGLLRQAGIWFAVLLCFSAAGWAFWPRPVGV